MTYVAQYEAADFVASMGAKLLDENTPGWAHRVSKDDLDMRSVRWCILGQVYNNYTALNGYSYGTRELDMEGDREQQEAYGFELPDALYENSIAWEDLTYAWFAQIDKRVP